MVNIVSLICVAANKPKILPTTAGIESFMPLFMLSMRLRKKANEEVKFCNTTAMRFVPLATLMGSPKAMNSVIEIIAPPPARVFITPTIMPESTKSSMIVLSPIIK